MLRDHARPFHGANSAQLEPTAMVTPSKPKGAAAGNTRLHASAMQVCNMPATLSATRTSEHSSKNSSCTTPTKRQQHSVLPPPPSRPGGDGGNQSRSRSRHANITSAAPPWMGKFNASRSNRFSAAAAAAGDFKSAEPRLLCCPFVRAPSAMTSRHASTRWCAMRPPGVTTGTPLPTRRRCSSCHSATPAYASKKPRRAATASLSCNSTP
mmetsp:Transcript_22/g.56  ORF Transcript_22/g.56 Transcript_22/m.56 type:complete len:210 (-) Transcript_22:319-948(-)